MVLALSYGPYAFVAVWRALISSVALYSWILLLPGNLGPQFGHFSYDIPLIPSKPETPFQEYLD